jgi:3-phenylpropionate/trans-cinnamate dioxygenase ferredoxin reductase subunit
MTSRTYVIVGGGLTAASAAAGLRSNGFDGRIVLLAEEPHLPYERPGLSKEYLRGEHDAASLQARPEAFYAEHDIEVRVGIAATAVRPAEQSIALSDGGTQPYDRLLLATGAAPRRLDIPGHDLPGVHLLRTIEDADAIRAAAEKAARVAVIGGGWIGAEVAASLRQSGADVTLVASSGAPLDRVLGPEVGAVYADLHRRNGVRLLTNTWVAALRGHEHVTAVEFRDGSTIPADLVIVGAGAIPRTELAGAAGIATDDGILVDESLATTIPGILAAGDVASAWHPLLGRRIRVEHWDNARKQGAHVAKSMLGERTPYKRLPYFFSDQFDLATEYTGFAADWDRVVFRGNPSSPNDGLFAFWLKDGRLLAAMKANSATSMKPLTALVAERPLADPDALADPDVPFETLMPVGNVEKVEAAA